MSLNLQFDNVAVAEDSIFGLHLKTKVFEDKFKMGMTVCRTAKLEVLKSAISSMPADISFNIVNPITAHMHIDSIGDTDDTYYELNLMDNMVYLNKVVDFSLCNTVSDVFAKIQSEFGFSYSFDNTTNILSYAFAWDGYKTARDVVSMIAEAYGGYAIFDNTTIQFKRYAIIPHYTIGVDEVGDLVVGDHHNITRIAYDNGVDLYEYGSPSGDTIYISADNVFFGDPSNTQDRLEAIGDFIIGNEFYNITVNDAPISGVFACDYMTIGTYNFYVQEDWDYNGEWIGGFDFQVQTAEQEETDVIYSELEKQVLSIRTTVNHQEGLLDILGTRTDGIEADLIHFQVDGAASEVRVTNQDSESPTSYTSFKGDGMRIYVEGEQVAEATARRFECDKGLGVQDWAIEQGASANTLIFYRKG